jgi:hypothetical protein
MLTGLISHVTFTEVTDGRFEVSSLKGRPIQTVTSGGVRSVDIVRASCSDGLKYETQWQMIVDTQAKAIRQGMQFPKLCK